jgi:hypothetical protein
MRDDEDFRKKQFVPRKINNNNCFLPPKLLGDHSINNEPTSTLSVINFWHDVVSHQRIWRVSFGWVKAKVRA